jgi:hypothetical protein
LRPRACCDWITGNLINDRSTPGGATLDTCGRGSTARAYLVPGQGRSDCQKTEPLSGSRLCQDKLTQKAATRHSVR